MTSPPQIEYGSRIVDPKIIKLPIFQPDVEKVKEIAGFIAVTGLQNKPIVKEKSLSIVAGKIRVLACIFNKMDEIEVRTVPEDTSEKTLQLISLHENLGRTNLEWYDQVKMQKQLHDIRQAEHGVGQKGKKAGWSLRDTAEELGVGLGPLSENIRLAEAFEKNPELTKIYDKQTAKRIILTESRRVVQELQTALPSAVMQNQVYHGSSEAILALFPDNTFDACITDPPWLEYKDRALTKDQFTFAVFEQVYKKLKANSFLYAFVGTADWHIYQNQLTELGFNVQKYPMIWIKEGVLTMGTLSWQYQRNFEQIIVAVKGTPALTADMLSSIISTKTVPPGKMIHPNEKPKEVIKVLLNHCTYEGASVLDPFGGSGVLGEACYETGRNYTIIERDAKFYAGIVDRLREIETAQKHFDDFHGVTRVSPTGSQ